MKEKKENRHGYFLSWQSSDFPLFVTILNPGWGGFG